MVSDPSNEEDKQAETTPLDDSDSDLRAMVVKQQNMVEHLCHQTTGLVKVIGMAILSSETVMSILQPEVEERR